MGKLGAFTVFVFSFVPGCAATKASSEDGAKTLMAWTASAPRPREADQRDAASPQKPASPGPEEEPLATDRPDFTEASSTVGKGRVQLEAGYTFARNREGGVTTTTHSYPEALLRVGALADWLELRVGQNFGNSKSDSPDGAFSAGGTQDLYLGVKLGLTQQKGPLPEMALVLQSQVPTGHREVSAAKLLPGANLLYGWDVIEDRLTLGGSSQMNRAIDDTQRGYVEVAQSLTVGYTLTKKVGAYSEWFAFLPAGAQGEGVTAQHYFNGGLTYRLTPNIQFDVRAGVGLSRTADDYFAGTGFGVRY